MRFGKVMSTKLPRGWRKQKGDPGLGRGRNTTETPPSRGSKNIQPIPHIHSYCSITRRRGKRTVEIQEEEHASRKKGRVLQQSTSYLLENQIKNATPRKFLQVKLPYRK
ncbi:hypothetical protein JTB14_034523 [Gonioctena quinquepunctata]|nr:hypothetical protein JTB14_034523 [Gonioctena quinquepunctata]